MLPEAAAILRGPWLRRAMPAATIRRGTPGRSSSRIGTSGEPSRRDGLAGSRTGAAAAQPTGFRCGRVELRSNQ